MPLVGQTLAHYFGVSGPFLARFVTKFSTFCHILRLFSAFCHILGPFERILALIGTFFSTFQQVSEQNLAHFVKKI